MPNQGKRVTIRDLAQELGLSLGTVSNALNGTTGQVSAATIARVEAAAKRLGYKRNKAAATLRSGRHGQIIVHVPNNVLSLSFYMQLTFGIAEILGNTEYDLVLVTDHNRHQNTLCDGAILVDWLPESRLAEQLIAANIPVVSAGDTPAHEPRPTAIVRVNYEELADKMVSHAIAAGGKSVAMLAPDRDFASDWATQIVAGVQNACHKHNISPAIVSVPVSMSAAEVVEAAKEVYISHRPDIFVFGPQRYAGIVVPTLGWGHADSEVPFVLSCAGDPVTELSSPIITAINPQPREFGIRCAQILIDILAAETKTQTPLTVEHPGIIHWAEHLNTLTTRLSV